MFGREILIDFGFIDAYVLTHCEDPAKDGRPIPPAGLAGAAVGKAKGEDHSCAPFARYRYR
jgi:hypothetical protein